MKLLYPILISLVLGSPLLAQDAAQPQSTTPLAGAGIPMDRMHYDARGDGLLFARGADYKARFGADGATFVPFLGSDAPRNMPVHLRLESATLGGEALRLNDSASWSRDGDSVTLERGEVDVRYNLQLGSMEQTFVLDELRNTGDLVVRVAVDSELELRASGEGFRFEGERGGVHYGSATVFDADGRNLAVESRLNAGAIEIRVPDDFLRTARLPLVVDPLITTFVTSGGAIDTWAGDMAFDATNQAFLNVYSYNWSQADGDVSSWQIDEAGNILAGSGVWIDISFDTWQAPFIANSNNWNNFIIVCVVRPGGGPGEIWSRLRQLPGNGMGLPLKLNQNGNHCGVASIGGDGNIGGVTYYCVTWPEYLGANVWALNYRFLRTDGNLGSTIIQLDTATSTIDPHIRVSKGNGNGLGDNRAWNIVWSSLDNTNDKDIFGAQISAAGLLITPPFTVDSTSVYHGKPSASAPLVSTQGGKPDYLVVYEASNGGQSDINARLFKGSTFQYSYDLTAIEAAVLGAQHVGHDQESPSIATDGINFIVGYSERSGGSGDRKIYCSTFSHMGAELFLAETQELVSSGAGDHTLARIASAADAGLYTSRNVAFSWLRSTPDQSGLDYDTLGAIYRTPAGYANIGTITCDGNNNTTGSAATFRVFGYDVPAFNQVFLDVDNLPPFQWGQFLMSQSTASLPISQGVLCLGGPQVRLPSTTTNSWVKGSVGTQLDLSSLPAAANLMPGQTWYFQFWYRDAGASNFSNAVRVDF